MEITLHPFGNEDVADYVALMNMPEIRPFTPHGARGLTLDEGQIWFEKMGLQPEAIGAFSIRYENTWVGVIKYSRLPRNEHGMQFGYYIQPQHQARGIGSTAISQFVSCMSQRGIIRFQALIEPENEFSQKAVKKNGFQLEGVLRSFMVFQGRLIDVCMYAKIIESKEKKNGTA